MLFRSCVVFGGGADDPGGELRGVALLTALAVAWLPFAHSTARQARCAFPGITGFQPVAQARLAPATGGVWRPSHAYSVRVGVDRTRCEHIRVRSTAASMLPTVRSTPTQTDEAYCGGVLT